MKDLGPFLRAAEGFGLFDVAASSDNQEVNGPSKKHHRGSRGKIELIAETEASCDKTHAKKYGESHHLPEFFGHMSCDGSRQSKQGNDQDNPNKPHEKDNGDGRHH